MKLPRIKVSRAERREIRFVVRMLLVGQLGIRPTHSNIPQLTDAIVAFAEQERARQHQDGVAIALSDELKHQEVASHSR